MFETDPPPAPITRPQDSPDWNGVGGLHESEQEGSAAASRSAPGLGDQVERIAQPIAKAIDRVLGTKIQECGGCKKRKEWLNNLSNKGGHHG